MTPAKTLLSFYDLRVAPVGFDFVTFLVLSDLARERAGCDSFQIVLVPDQGTSLRTQKQGAWSADHSNWRITTMLMPMVGLFPTCHGFTACVTRDQAKEIVSAATGPVHPQGYDPDFPNELYWGIDRVFMNGNLGATLPQVTPPDQALAYVDSWIAPRSNGRKVVTVTLREATHTSSRNSDLDAWLAFLSWLDTDVYFPVILADIERVFEPVRPQFQPYTHFNEAVVNPQLRAALYQRAFVNLSVGAGPEELFRYNGATRYIKFKSVPPDFLQKFSFLHGLPTDGRYPFCAPYHQIIDQSESFDLIRAEFQKMAARIDADPTDAFKRHPLRFPATVDDDHIAAVATRYFNAGEFPKQLQFMRLVADLRPEAVELIERLIALALSTHYEFIDNGYSRFEQQPNVCRDYRRLFAELNAAHPEMMICPMLWAVLEISLGDHETAQRLIDLVYRQMPSDDPFYPRLLTAHGFLRLRQRRFEEACALYRRAREANGNPVFVLQHAMVLEHADRIDEAIDALRELMEAGLNSAAIRHRYDKLVKARGHVAEALLPLTAEQ